MTEYTKKLALVTGGSSGMGLEYARQLAAKGCDLLLVSNQQKELGEAQASLAADFGVDVAVRFQDLATPEAAAELLAFCKEEGLLPDVLVCNAGMFFFKELGAADCAIVEKMLNLHVTTVTKMCLLFGEEMKSRGSGTIIIMSSMTAKLPAPGITIYSATKAYLLSFGKSLWFEMKPYGVTVTTVCPAAVATPLYRMKPSLMRLGVKCGVIHTPQWLVRRALRAAGHGRRVIRPSLMNYYLPPLVALLPAGLESAIWEKLKKNS